MPNRERIRALIQTTLELTITASHRSKTHIPFYREVTSGNLTFDGGTQEHTQISIISAHNLPLSALPLR